MPSREALEGLPTVNGGSSGSSEPLASVHTNLLLAPTGARTANSLTNLLPQATASLTPASAGVYVGDGLPPVPQKLADKIRRWEFVDMGELLPEFWSLPKDEDSAKSAAPARRSRKVTDIFSWLQCYATYASVLGPQFPEAIPELLAYMASIIRVSQDYSGLAWVRYDAAFRRQAALTGNRRWSQINATIYTVCFTGNAQVSSRCELCLGTTHSSKECALRGDPDPEMQARVKAIETAVLALAAKQVKPISTGQVLPSGQVCRLWNRNACTYTRCRHAHVCSSCGADHPAVSCTKTPHVGVFASGQSTSSMANRRARDLAKPY